jgi:Domain of unknown function (DUF4926)
VRLAWRRLEQDLRGAHDSWRMRRVLRTPRDGASRENAMKFKLLECVVIDVDVPELGLVKGDPGVVVEILDADNVMVEVFEADESTRDVYTLNVRQVRSATPSELQPRTRRP